ncbi:hypothetical protein TNCT_589061 [Trichonephila clavata]|uniref:Uncharacterized protein n=1 Tax=Trichonephila clavata TaxID=2740835 RepID=A0A8X6I4T8_TRICU|nr:hypothetical protein TNCT_589061 [Trichonephila clavata]
MLTFTISNYGSPVEKTALPSIEDFAKEIAVKKNLTLELSKSIHVIQEESLGKSIVPDNEYSSNLCSVLEAIFIHGLKDKITRKMSAVFGSNPEKIQSLNSGLLYIILVTKMSSRNKSF